MVVNVGLLVHHKINLQNSVDLAAYYGAMKQAEVLNSIAHINYQIRQDWKLLVFRHRHLGMGGFDGGPYQRPPPTGGPGKIIDEKDEAISYEPSFCMAYAPFDFMYNQGGSAESYCKKQNSNIPLPGVPKGGNLGIFAVGPLSSLFSTIITSSNAAVATIKKDCKSKMTYNAYALASFIWAYKMDLMNRKKVIYKLAQGLSKSDSDFTDIDGESGADGIKNTLTKNLTAQNRDGKLNVEIMNSMGEAGCGTNHDDKASPDWLREIFFYPNFDYSETDCEGTNNQLADIRKLFTDGSLPKYREGNVGNIVTQIMPVLAEPPGNTPDEKALKSTIGFEKNPWCVTYVGVKASAEPSIPFSPFGSVTLTATAFAKPFGGRIGPWYKENWTPGLNHGSDSGKEIDKVGYVKVEPGQWFSPNVDQATRKKMAPNFSRYVGDTLGNNSKLTTANIEKMINESSKDPFSINWFNHLTAQDYNNVNQDSDILAWDSINSKPAFLRDLEISAIVPDQFDMTYYSIDPDFYRNYYLRLRKNPALSSLNVRGDIGMRPFNNDTKLKKFSIKDQLEVLHKKNYLEFKTKLTYFVETFAELLTSWQPMRPDNPKFDESRFGKCEQDMTGTQIQQDNLPDVADDSQTTVGSCLKGGRVGYSVKLVDGEYLTRSDLELGGKDQRGALLNPPRASFISK